MIRHSRLSEQEQLCGDIDTGPRTCVMFSDLRRQPAPTKAKLSPQDPEERGYKSRRRSKSPSLSLFLITMFLKNPKYSLPSIDAVLSEASLPQEHRDRLRRVPLFNPPPSVQYFEGTPTRLGYAVVIVRCFSS